ncbi:hypothetical protein B0A49_00223 [Cryomyces minteri]|uniref:Uncharacterized protein n=1 Tax=Cryomyces minteri TaxID=331657 RepID=A0A4V6WLB2_9PEZI|nr:hypothetical protein B0A49_00223 [Cryomyces minteri]
MSSSTALNSNPLAARDVNTQSQPTSSMGGFDTGRQGEKGEDNKPKSMEYHRQVLESRLKGGEGDKQTYISPSDSIMSPASQKLTAFKERAIGRKDIPKKQSLFAKTMTSREKDLGPVGQDKGMGGFRDI